MKLGTLINEYDISLDTLVSYLKEQGVSLPVPIKHKTQIPNKLKPQLDRKFGINYHSATPESKYKTWRQELPLIHREALVLVDSRPGSKRLAKICELLVLVVNKIKDYCLKHVDLKPDAQRLVSGLLNGVNERLSQEEHQEKSQTRERRIQSLSSIKKQYTLLLFSFEDDKVVLEQDVPWDEVVFKDGGLLINANSEKNLYLPCTESKEVFNHFNYAFTERIPPLRIRLHSKNPIEIVRTPELDEIFRFLTIQNDIRLGNFFKHKELYDLIVHSKTDFHQSFLPKDRTPYFQYLVEKQSPDHRYVPMFETDGDSEDSFLFTIQGNNNLFIVWESLRPNTATYVFPVEKINYERFLQSLYDYACSDIDYKRRRVHHGVIDGLHGIKGSIVNHYDFQQWKTELDMIVLGF